MASSGVVGWPLAPPSMPEPEPAPRIEGGFFLYLPYLPYRSSKTIAVNEAALVAVKGSVARKRVSKVAKVPGK